MRIDLIRRMQIFTRRWVRVSNYLSSRRFISHANFATICKATLLIPSYEKEGTLARSARSKVVSDVASYIPLASLNLDLALCNLFYYMCHWKSRQRYQLTSRCLMHVRYICQKTAVGMRSDKLCFRSKWSPFFQLVQCAQRQQNWIIWFTFRGFQCFH